MFRNNPLWAGNVYYRKEIKVIYYTLPGCSHWDMPPTHETGENGQNHCRRRMEKNENEPRLLMVYGNGYFIPATLMASCY